ncbi:MAG TPA: GldG family protein [Candidatus Nanoarchaeia archaeon]|nr:GldG family protein [Candidatus Nanoarchaeia archaeon]
MDKLKKILAKIKSWKLPKGGDNFITIIIIIGLLLAVNFIFSQIHFRWDLTANGDYSLAAASKKTAAALPDVVNIKTYFSKNLPAQYLDLQQQVGDLLDEYASYSNGKIKVRQIDPATLKDAQNELAAKGIPTLQFNVLRNDSYQVVNGYLGIALQYGDKSEVIPVVSDTSNLEYQVTSDLKKLTGKNLPVIGLVTSNKTVPATGDPNSGDTLMTQSYAKLTDLYQVKNIDLSKDALTDDITALLIVGPKDKFTDDELKKIDAFVMKGKSLILLVDGVNVAKGLSAAKNDLGLDKLLGAYGLKVNTDLITDTSNGRASFSSNNGSYTMSYMINYPLWPKILPNNMDKTNVIVANLQSLIFPWASSIAVTPKDGENVVYLAKSSGDAREETDNFALDPQAAGNVGGQVRQYNFAVYVSGKLMSAFGTGSTDKARIAVVGDSDFATDNFTGQGSDNLLFFQNLVDGLSLDSDLINIRAKTATERPITLPSTAAKETMRYLNIFGVTAAVLIFGVLRYFWRRRNKKQVTSSM